MFSPNNGLSSNKNFSNIKDLLILLIFPTQAAALLSGGGWRLAQKSEGVGQRQKSPSV